VCWKGGEDVSELVREARNHQDGILRGKKAPSTWTVVITCPCQIEQTFSGKWATV
jgi:hypothetical protein